MEAKKDFIPPLYGVWTGNPLGEKYDREKCAEKVFPNGSYISSQCSRKNGHGKDGLYCKQHAKKAIAKATE